MAETGGTSGYRGLFEAAIARLQPGNAMERAAFEGIESGKRTAVGSAMQNLVSGGMAGSSLAGSVPIIAEKAAASSRLGVTAAREQLLSGVETNLAGLLFQGEETEKGRQFTAAQNQLNQEFQAKQAALDREYSSAEARKSEAYQTKQSQLTRDFTAAQNALDRQYGISTAARTAANTAALQSSAQKFTAEQNALNRTAQYPSLTGSNLFSSTPPSLLGGTTTGGILTSGWDTASMQQTFNPTLDTTSYVQSSPWTGSEWTPTYKDDYTPTQMTNYGTSTAPQTNPIQGYINDWLTYGNYGGGGGGGSW